MKYIAKGIIAGYIVLSFLLIGRMSTIELILLLSLIAISLLTDLKSKKIVSVVLAVECIIVFLIGNYTNFVFWGMMILLFDIIYTSLYYIGAILTGEFIYFKTYDNNIEIWLIAALVAIVAYIINDNLKKQKHYHDILDTERRTKYELELTKSSLIQSNKEVEKLVEAKERNRIARDLHDNIGHSVAGILINLQAAKKVMQRDMQKGNTMIDDCITHLKKSLQILRDTVHNMYSHDKRGVDYIKNIIDKYKYCDAQINISGNFVNCNERTFEVMAYVLKEALTNTAKHSKAKNVFVDINSRNYAVIMSIKDDGTGCANINESLGIRSMRDRIMGLYGTLKINGDEGMHILCEIPLLRGEYD